MAKGLIAALLWSLIVCGGAYGDIVIVRKAKALADIVLPENPLSSVRRAAGDLQVYIEQISGARLPVVSAPSDGFQNHIYVGESSYTKQLGLSTDDLKPEGFKIVAQKNYIALIGRDNQRRPFPYDGRSDRDLVRWQSATKEYYRIPDISLGRFNHDLGFFNTDATATLYAASEFLEQLGIRWYHPYEHGTVIPVNDTIQVPAGVIKRAPAFPYRAFTYYNAMEKDAEGILWFKRLKYGISQLYHCNHSIQDILSLPRQRKAHPEYYAKRDGKIVDGFRGKGVPKLSNPAFRNTSLKYLDTLIKTYPEIEGVSLGMPDGFTHIDEHDEKIWVNSQRPYTAKYSDYVWDYWLDLAKKLKQSHPTKYLIGLSYTTYLEPPSKVDRLPENIALMLAYNTGYDLPTPEGAYIKNIRAQWLLKLSSKKFFVWDYYRFYADDRPRIPIVFTKLLQEEMQYLSGVCQGKFIEIYPNFSGPDKGKVACPGLTHLLIYLQGKLYWNPKLDREKLLQEYYHLYFGPAAAEMAQFYSFAEQIWTKPGLRTAKKPYDFLTAEIVAKYFDMLKRADEKTGRGTIYEKRIMQIESEMQPLKAFLK